MTCFLCRRCGIYYYFFFFVSCAHHHHHNKNMNHSDTRKKKKKSKNDLLSAVNIIFATLFHNFSTLFLFIQPYGHINNAVVGVIRCFFFCVLLLSPLVEKKCVCASCKLSFSLPFFVREYLFFYYYEYLKEKKKKKTARAYNTK